MMAKRPRKRSVKAKGDEADARSGVLRFIREEEPSAARRPIPELDPVRQAALECVYEAVGMLETEDLIQITRVIVKSTRECGGHMLMAPPPQAFMDLAYPPKPPEPPA